MHNNTRPAAKSGAWILFFADLPHPVNEGRGDLYLTAYLMDTREYTLFESEVVGTTWAEVEVALDLEGFGLGELTVKIAIELLDGFPAINHFTSDP